MRCRNPETPRSKTRLLSHEGGLWPWDRSPPPRLVREPLLDMNPAPSLVTLAESGRSCSYLEDGRLSPEEMHRFPSAVIRVPGSLGGTCCASMKS
jgi:hypothetical protein